MFIGCLPDRPNPSRIQDSRLGGGRANLPSQRPGDIPSYPLKTHHTNRPNVPSYPSRPRSQHHSFTAHSQCHSSARPPMRPPLCHPWLRARLAHFHPAIRACSDPAAGGLWLPRQQHAVNRHSRFGAASGVGGGGACECERERNLKTERNLFSEGFRAARYILVPSGRRRFGASNIPSYPPGRLLVDTYPRKSRIQGAFGRLLYCTPGLVRLGQLNWQRLGRGGGSRRPWPACGEGKRAF